MRIPTTVIGSYPVRLDGAKYAKAYFADSKADASSESIELAVSAQADAGIDIVSDGQTRGDFINIYARNFKGVAMQERPIVYSKLEYTPGSQAEDLKSAKGFLPKGVKIKGIITGPYTMAKGSVDRHYQSIEKLSYAYAEGLALEAKQMAKVADFIQIDEPFFSVDYPKYGRELVEMVFAGVKKKSMLHVCGDVSKIFPKLAEYKVDYLLHEFAANPGLWDVVSKAEFGQRLGVGVVRSDINKVETVAETASRMRKAIDYIEPKRLVFNPDCGLRNLDPEVAYGKLKNMVSARDLVSQEI